MTRARRLRYIHPGFFNTMQALQPSFRVKRMLTRLVAEKFTDHSGIDWAEIVRQFKELAGHTATSLGRAYQKLFFSKCQSSERCCELGRGSR